MNTPENNLITVFVHKEIATLYKTFLEIIEDMQKDQQIMLDKVAEKSGKEFVRDINCFSPEKYEQIRKRVLDQGNEQSRKIINFLDFFEFIINKNKVEEAAKQKRTIVKKVIINGTIGIE